MPDHHKDEVSSVINNTTGIQPFMSKMMSMLDTSGGIAVPSCFKISNEMNSKKNSKEKSVLSLYYDIHGQEHQYRNRLYLASLVWGKKKKRLSQRSY